MPFWKKKKPENDLAFKFELIGDDRDDALTEHQLDGVRILAEMEAKLEVLRRKGEIIEPRYYGFKGDAGDVWDKYRFEHPMEGVELMRRFAGQETKWFRFRDEEEKAAFKPFEGEPATCRFV